MNIAHRPVEVNIYYFIADPFKAVMRGYRPDYLTCVSAVSHHWGTTARLFFEEICRLRLIPDILVREVPRYFVRPVLALVVTIFFPVTVWLLAWIQYRNC